MTDKPIIFSAPMIRALLDGRKTQTRRILKPQPPEGLMPERMAIAGEAQPVGAPWSRCDRLWVREAFVRYYDLDDNDMRVGPLKIAYRADGGFRWLDADTDTFRDTPPWKPSIHMPRWASRLTLIVTDVRVQRLQDINEADARSEGWKAPPDGVIGWHPIGWFSDLWNSIHGPDAWDANPWVAALTFTVHKKNIDQMEAAE